MEGVGYILAVGVDNVWIGDYGNPVVFASFRGFDSVHAETAGETRDTPENTLKGFTQVMADVILKYLKYKIKYAINTSIIKIVCT